MTTDVDTASGAAVEVPAPVEAETPEVTAPETPEDATEADASESEQDKEGKAIKALQRRIDRRTRDLYEARARAERAEQELAAARQTKEPAETPNVDVEALAQAKARELVEQQSLQRKVGETLAKGRALEGFDTACNTAIEELGLLNANGQPTPLLSVFLEADAPHEVLYHIGKNPEVADEFSGLTPTQAARRLAKLETELAAAKAPKVSAAPKPIKPVSGNSAGSDVDPSQMTDAQFAAWRKKQIEARHAR